MTTIDSGKPPLPRVALGVTLRKSQGETEEDFERRTQKLNEFRDYKRRNFPQENLVLPEKPLLTNSYHQRRQSRPKTILTNGSLRSCVALMDAATATKIMPVPSGVTGKDTDASESIVGRSVTGASTSTTTAASTSPALSFEQEDKELQKKLEERNPVIDMSVYVIPRGILDLSKYFIQADINSDHQVTKKMAGEILKDLFDNLGFGEENGNQDCQNNSSEKEIKVTSFQRFGRSLKSLKTRIVRRLRPLTSCCSSKTTYTTD